MKRTDIQRKTAVRCEQCQSIFTAAIGSSGDVLLLGLGDRCNCGGTEFHSFA